MTKHTFSVLHHSIFLSVFLLVAICISSSAFAALSLTPGLWEVSSIIKSDGQTIDPRARMKEMYANMTPEKRKQMESVMAKMGSAMPSADGSMKVCFSKEMVEHNEALMAQKSDCETTSNSRTATKAKMSFKCKDGSSGEGEWSFDKPSVYDGKMLLTTADGKKSEITHHGKFISANCGAVKPLHMPLKKK